MGPTRIGEVGPPVLERSLSASERSEPNNQIVMVVKSAYTYAQGAGGNWVSK